MLSLLRAPWVATAMRVVFVLLVLAVTVLSLMPDPEIVPGGFSFQRWVSQLLFGTADHEDKVSHFIAYGVLGGAGVMAARHMSRRINLFLPLGLICYSGLIEIAQGLGGARQADWADLGTNALGVLAGTLGGLCVLLALRYLADKEAA